MAFFSKVVGGALAAGGLTYFYHSQIISTTTQLHNDLKDLSESLVSLAPSTPTTPASYPLPPPTRLSLGENMKARFNEHVQSAFKGMHETNWSLVAQSAWQAGSDGVGALKTKLAPAAEVVKGDQKVV